MQLRPAFLILALAGFALPRVPFLGKPKPTREGLRYFVPPPSVNPQPPSRLKRIKKAIASPFSRRSRVRKATNRRSLLQRLRKKLNSLKKRVLRKPEQPIHTTADDDNYVEIDFSPNTGSPGEHSVISGTGSRSPSPLPPIHMMERKFDRGDETSRGDSVAVLWRHFEDLRSQRALTDDPSSRAQLTKEIGRLLTQIASLSTILPRSNRARNPPPPPRNLPDNDDDIYDVPRKRSYSFADAVYDVPRNLGLGQGNDVYDVPRNLGLAHGERVYDVPRKLDPVQGEAVYDVPRNIGPAQAEGVYAVPRKRGPAADGQGVYDVPRRRRWATLV